MGSSSGWRWEQSNKELSLLLDVEADVRAKEVRVNLTSQVRFAPHPRPAVALLPCGSHTASSRCFHSPCPLLSLSPALPPPLPSRPPLSSSFYSLSLCHPSSSSSSLSPSLALSLHNHRRGDGEGEEEGI